MMRLDAVQRWPVAKKRAVERALHRAIEIAVVEHHQRILAAHLELHARVVRHRGLGDAGARALAAGERHAGDVGMLDERAAHRAAAEDQVEHALRESRLVDDLRQRVRRGRRQRGGLHDHGVAERQRGRALPRRNRDREIPGRDQSEHAERLAVGFHRDAGARRVHRHAVTAQRLAREELEDARRAHDFALALGQRLAFFARQQAAEIVRARHDQSSPTLSSRSERTSGLAFAQRRKGGLRRGDGAIYRLLVAARHLRDDVARVGGIETVGGGRARDPLPIDVMGKLFCVAHVLTSIQEFRRPRRARLRIRSAMPNDQGGAWSQVVTLFSSTPSFSVDTRTTSPLLCVNPWPGSAAIDDGREHGAQEQREAVRIAVVLADGLADEFGRIAADLRHRALAFEPEAFLALDLQLAPRAGARRRA